ncbi:MAG: hypothetical protein JSS86_20155, partial [Cyanobacteria bacterium SZAS LIN-2]|nr:hypothetical protein [Cyanobacteria bacterium SZAS LIN-2]
DGLKSIFIPKRSCESGSCESPWKQPVRPAGDINGKVLTPEQKLYDAEYKKLSSTESSEYAAETRALTIYEAKSKFWNLDRLAPAQARPHTPIHDKIDAQVRAEEKAIEAKVLQRMTPAERKTYTYEKEQYQKAEEEAFIKGMVEVPPAVTAFNDAVAKEMGLESTRYDLHRFDLSPSEAIRL